MKEDTKTTCAPCEQNFERKVDELVKEGKVRFLGLSEAAPETIRAGLETLLADPAAARTRAENARQNLCSHFTWQAVFATMMEAVTSAKRS